MSRGVCLSVLTLAALALPASAHARDFAITSFDGTRIEAHFFPAHSLLPGQPAPTVLLGPGWGNGGLKNGAKETSEPDGVIGTAPLRRAGYNVLTWDPRGFGASGGEAKVDSPHFEARDVKKLIDALADIPEAELDEAGDPRVGMAGGSYGGGIQWVTAAIDDRVDAITPDIAWHSLVTSLYKDGAFKAGWASYLCGLGAGQGVSSGLINPAGLDPGSMDPHMYSICQSGLATGAISATDENWLADRGPLETWMQRVRAPALILHGTVDTLFTLSEAIANYEILNSNDVPARMMWFCGGHGVCNTNPGFPRYVEAAVLRWFSYHLKREQVFGPGPEFEWLDQYGAWRFAPGYPIESAGQLTGEGSGTLQLTAGDTATSGTAIGATPAVNGIQVPVGPPERGGEVVGAPTVELEYSGTGTSAEAHIYAQVVDLDRDIVLGGQVTPLPLTLDGRTHTLQRPLEAIAHAVGPESDLVVQVIPATNVYGQQRTTGTVALSQVTAALPLVRAYGESQAPPTDDQGSGDGGGTVDGGAVPPPPCRPSFRPQRATVGRRGLVRLRPRVRCGGESVHAAVTIRGGERAWRGQTGERAVIRVGRRVSRLRARFSHDGRAYRRVVRLSRD